MVLCTLLLSLVVMAACSAAGSGPGPSHPPANQGGNLPTPIVLAGTTPPGSAAFLGPVMRVTAKPTAPAPGGGGDLTIAFRQFGTGRDLLLVSGQAATMSWWDTVLLLQLAQTWRVTIFDLPGVGFSGPAAGTATSIPSLADATAGLAAALGLSRPAVIGWGMGGQIALELAIRHPKVVSRLVLADSSGGGALAVPTRPGLAAMLASPLTTNVVIARIVFPAGEVRSRGTWLRAMALEPPDDVIAAALAAEARAERQFAGTGAARSQLARLGVKVLVVEGGRDALFAPSDASSLVSAIPGARELTVPAAGYGAILSLAPAQLAELERFLAA